MSDKIVRPIPIEDLNGIIKEYKQTIQNGKSGRDSTGKEVTNQTKWIYFTQDEIERLIDFLNTDPECKDLPKDAKGIKIYLGAYTKKIAEKYYPENHNEYVGHVTAALVTAKGKKEGTIENILLKEENGEIILPAQVELDQRKPPVENVGTVCPPNCG